MNKYSKFIEWIENFKKINSTYNSSITHFVEFLHDRLLEDEIFDFKKEYIDQFIIYASKYSIGSVSSLTTHTAALTKLFEFLISNGFDNEFHPLLGYIKDANFSNEIKSKFDIAIRKPTLDSTLLNSTLYKIDVYIEKNLKEDIVALRQKQSILKIMIARIYIKLSLLIPLKPENMLNLEILDITEKKLRTIKYNGIIIKVPNSLREQILMTIKFAEEKFGNNYIKNDMIFHSLYGCISKKVSAPNISDTLECTYKKLKINELLQRKSSGKSGKKDRYVYPAECYKKTAILSMLENGTNIVYLKKLTGLSFQSLEYDFDYEKDIYEKDIISNSINSGIVLSEYYTYL